MPPATRAKLMRNTTNETQALENAITYYKLTGVKLHKKWEHDKRRTIGKYFISFDGAATSPVLPYEQMNHYIMGIGAATKHNIKQTQ